MFSAAVVLFQACFSNADTWDGRPGLMLGRESRTATSTPFEHSIGNIYALSFGLLTEWGAPERFGRDHSDDVDISSPEPTVCG